MDKPFSIEGKRVLITGGTRGLGRAISLHFARSGAKVIANYARDTAAADAFLREVETEGLSIGTVRADLATDKGMRAVVEAVGAQFSSLSCLIHCAATGVHRPLEQLTLRHFDWTFSLNIRALFELSQKLVPRIERGGTILGVSSAGATRAIAQYALVGSSKAALESMLRHMAVELAPKGIRVNVIRPGTLLTDVWKVLPDSDTRLADATARSALGRLCTLQEVAQAAHFLCSDAASGIIGHSLVVDGGAALTE
jgi:enoyl-[acyl-carrier protein] reductase III